MENQLISINSSQVQLIGGGDNNNNNGQMTTSVAAAIGLGNPLGIEDYGSGGIFTSIPSSSTSSHHQHVHYQDQSQQRSFQNRSPNTDTINKNNNGHHHHLLLHPHLIPSDRSVGDATMTGVVTTGPAILMTPTNTKHHSQSPSMTDTPTIAYYPMHSFTNNSSTGEISTLMDSNTTTMGRTSRIRFSLDSNNASAGQQYLDHQHQQQHLTSTIFTNNDANNTILSGSTQKELGTLKRVKI